MLSLIRAQCRLQNANTPARRCQCLNRICYVDSHPPARSGYVNRLRDDIGKKCRRVVGQRLSEDKNTLTFIFCIR